MIYQFIFLPFLGLLLVFFQTSVLNLVSMGWISIELSMILVIYAGFRVNVLSGALMSFMLGFVLDCMMGVISGLFTLIYVCIFFASHLVSLRVYAEQMRLIVVFSFVCALFEGLMVVLFYKILYDVNLVHSLMRVFLPQAVVVGMLSPLFFKLFRYFESLLHDGNPQPAQ